MVGMLEYFGGCLHIPLCSLLARLLVAESLLISSCAVLFKHSLGTLGLAGKSTSKQAGDAPQS